MNALKKVGNFLAPKAQKSEDGRDKWGTRTSFVLAAVRFFDYFDTTVYFTSLLNPYPKISFALSSRFATTD
jgi:hypothetical protein